MSERASLGEASFDPDEGAGPTLVVFDFDGTLAEHRGSWGLLYRLFGVERAGQARTEAFWDSELTFPEWCAGNVADWRERGVRREHLDRAAAAVKLTRGAEELLTELTGRNVPFGVVSGGVLDIVERVEPFDPAFMVANEIIYEDGVPTRVIPRVPPDAKGEILEELGDRAGVDPTEFVYVGDSHTDEEAIVVAGTTVAFDPDSRIDKSAIETADHVVRERDLTELIPILFGDASAR